MKAGLVLWTIALQSAEVLSMYFLRNGNVIAGMAGYAGVALIFRQAMDEGGLAVTNGLWNAFSSISGGIIGVHVFQEELNAYKAVGLGLAIASSYLLSIDEVDF